jgi:hypothetical protein
MVDFRSDCRHFRWFRTASKPATPAGSRAPVRYICQCRLGHFSRGSTRHASSNPCEGCPDYQRAETPNAQDAHEG